VPVIVTTTEPTPFASAIGSEVAAVAVTPVPDAANLNAFDASRPETVTVKEVVPSVEE